MLKESNVTTRLQKEVQLAFSPTGALARGIHSYRPRQSQYDMALAVSDAIDQKHNVILEAGTGVGKTYGYLIPALLSGKQIIISTGSKNLQEQLFFKDLPLLLKMFSVAPKTALLKGRSNYLCQLKLDKNLQHISQMPPKVVDELIKINQWASVTKDGDIGNLTAVAENSATIATVTSTKETCTGKRCSFYDDCFNRKAKIKAQDAKVVVVNHHLFFADRLLKDTGFAELLPDADVVVFDEAHLVPDVCINYFGQQIPTRELDRLLHRIIEVYRNELRDTIQLEQLSQRCLIKLASWQNDLIDADVSDWRQVISNKSLASSSWELLKEFNLLTQVITEHVGRSESLDDIVVKLSTLVANLYSYFECNDSNAAYSVEPSGQHTMLRISPINIAKQCQQLFDKQTQWIFTSATLQVNRQLTHFADEMGLSKAKQMILDSPFDYPNQAMFCVPRHLAKSGQSAANVNQLVDVCIQAINAAQGRTFILFTSHQMLQQVAIALQRRVQYPLLVQGSASKQSLLNKFRQLGNGVLLGTSSFWEGVDVRGRLLSCVIIDKLPFVSPDDTLYRARAANAERSNKDPFASISLPQAVISLKQGVGRLIRDEKDRGVLILCDNRIVNKAYGEAFINSLPPMHRTRDLDKALSFLKSIP
ncbi:ATP-dependent DNA helicase [Shewanella sp. 3_MG-2023]|uniref:ATP-dependent DNA helicase n=1 Tax=Shewanella sp. 3_MG-2023 TaxID=3062635 RepID=UPI0026E1FFBD|nr:ATP-dependent DNA helicase [Shewanella sp. 3_MG-2023]MDO6776085.1 ATP-dependent DNA helicase [Shewanella sp. 3_MG-2023]